MKKIRQWVEGPTFSNVTGSIVAIIVGLLFGLVILILQILLKRLMDLRPFCLVDLQVEIGRAHV